MRVLGGRSELQGATGKSAENKNQNSRWRPAQIANKNRGLSLIFPLGVVLSVLILASCVSGQRPINHSFSFDSPTDSPDIEILDYRYGDYLLTKAPNYRVDGRIRQSLDVYAAMKPGDILHVKWKIMSTGVVHEDTVDLRDRLPTEIEGSRVHFIIDGAKLYVYLISPEKISNQCPPDLRIAKEMTPGDKILRMYCSRRISNLYPEQPNF